MLLAAILVLFPAAMVFAAVSDLLTMTISNRVSVVLLLGFVVLAVAAGLSVHVILIHLGCGLGVLVLTFAMFALGWIGGGDAKLAAAIAVWMGNDQLLDYGVEAAMIGGALTIALILVRKLPLPLSAAKIDWIARLHDHRVGVPYGIALAAAGLLLYPQTILWAVGTTA